MTVSVSKSPGHIFCDAYPWALRPTTERPAAPTYDQITTSPFSTVPELDGISGTVVLDLEPLYLGGVEYSGNVVMPTMQFLPTMTGNGIYQLFMVMTGGWFMIVLTTLSIHIYTQYSTVNVRLHIS